MMTSYQHEKWYKRLPKATQAHVNQTCEYQYQKGYQYGMERVQTEHATALRAILMIEPDINVDGTSVMREVKL